MSNMNQCLEANPDISGLGVRISFYVQTIALGRSLEEALNSVWTLLGTSFGLTVSALVTAGRAELPLYQAIIVTDLVWLANWAIFTALATYNRHPRGSHAVQYAALAQTYLSMGSILILWARAPALEAAHGHAGQTVFVVVFAPTKAVGAGRVVALVVTGILLLGYSVVAAVFLWRHLLHPRRQRESVDGGKDFELTSRSSTPPPPAVPAAPGAPPTRLPPSLALDPHLIILALFIGLPYVVTVVSTELQIHRNRLCSDNASWGFGQILALTVTIVPLAVTVQAFRKYGWRQRARAVPGEGHLFDSGGGFIDGSGHAKGGHVRGWGMRRGG
ncbi:hypothetical protein DFH06DRAFT_503576 [Mycena polygramma]|nr:hypothetical protein DFH06DRAFT_503576 [Mycena polygramma]